MDESERPQLPHGDEQRNFADMSAPRPPDDRHPRPRSRGASDPNNGLAAPSARKDNWDPTKKPGKAQRSRPEGDDLREEYPRGGSRGFERGAAASNDARDDDLRALGFEPEPRKPVRTKTTRSRPMGGNDRERTWDTWDDDEFGRPARQDDLGFSAHESPPVEDNWQRESWSPPVDRSPLEREARPGRRRGDTGNRPDRAGKGASWSDTFSFAVADLRQTTQQLASDGKERLLSTKRGRMVAAVLCAALLLCVASTLGTAIFGFAEYQHVLGEAKAGIGHLDNAKAAFKQLGTNPFNSQNIEQARSELLASETDFLQVNSDLHVFPGALTTVPSLGAKLDAAFHVVPIAIEATQAGVAACDILAILSARLKDPLNSGGSGVTPADMVNINTYFAVIDNQFGTIVSQVQSLPASAASLDPRLGSLLATVRTNLPKIVQGEQDARAVITALPSLIGVGQPSTYMLEVLDSTELRPGGGFLGNYGYLTLSGGRMSGIHMQDVDLLDNSAKYGGQVIPIPPQYNWFSTYTRWGYRDSNLDADFPTSARNGLQLYYQEGGAGQFQGVIAITPWLIQNALKLTGNVTLPEYSPAVTVTPDNLIDEIHQHQLGGTAGPDNQYDPACGSSYRKCFTAYLFKHFLAQAKTSLTNNFGKFGKLMIDSFHSKDIQIYFTKPSVESVIEHYHLGSTIEAPTTGDSMYIVDANINGDKANSQISYNVTDQVKIDTSGTATHHLVMTYTWPDTPSNRVNAFQAGPTLLYVDFLRVYVPPGATLTNKDGYGVDYPTTKSFGREVFAGYLDVPIGTTGTVTLDWSVPHAAIHTGSVWYYPYLVQKQGGVTKPTDIEVSLPSCSAVVGLKGFVTPSAHVASFKPAGGQTRDENLEVDYTC